MNRQTVDEQVSDEGLLEIIDVLQGSINSLARLENPATHIEPVLNLISKLVKLKDYRKQTIIERCDLKYTKEDYEENELKIRHINNKTREIVTALVRSKLEDMKISEGFDYDSLDHALSCIRWRPDEWTDNEEKFEYRILTICATIIQNHFRIHKIDTCFDYHGLRMYLIHKLRDELKDVKYIYKT